MAQTSNRFVKTGLTMFGILQTIQTLDGASPAEIAERQDLARSTVYEYLATLQKERFVVKTDAGYHLGLRFLEYGLQAKSRYEIADVAQPTLQHIADTTKGLACLYVEEHGHAVCLVEVEGDRAVLTVEQIGRAIPLHAISTGKIFLANKPEKAIGSYIKEYGLEPLTQSTITDPDKLRRELKLIRENGWSCVKAV